ncbi:MAG: CbiX/SirB N-terminal domain-containing protein [Clostridium sp.]
MKGVLLLAHGSREKSTELTMDKITGYVKEELGLNNVICAYLQFSDKTLEWGINTLIEKGAKDIKVVPYFLFEGVHIKEDIPEEINKILKHHNDIKVTLGNTLGDDRRLGAILADRVRELI